MTPPPGEKLQNVSIMTRGSRGDVQPYVAIALALREQLNCSVRILTNEDFGPLIESFAGVDSGITHVPIFGNAEKVMREDPLLVKSQEEGDAAALFEASAKLSEKTAPETCRLFLEEMKTHRPDLLICSIMAEYCACYAAIALKIPTMPITLNVFTPNPKRAPLGLPTLPFGLHDYLLFTLMIGKVKEGWKYFDDAMAALPGGQHIMDGINWKGSKHRLLNPELPVLVCKSPLFQPILNPVIHENYNFIGAAIIEKKYEEKHLASSGGDNSIFDKLTEFIDSDPSRKPVYMGWGSMRCKSQEHMVILAVDALRKSNQRGIVLGGWAQLSQSILEKSTEDADLISYAKKNILFVDKAPHEWLMPKVAAAVHHGGAGTTNASMRSGVPSIITPVFCDQFDNAYLVEQLGVGVGFSKQFQKISADELAGAIEKVVNKDGDYCEKAKALGSKLLKEGGASTTATHIERYWCEFVTTGQWENTAKKVLKSENGDETDDGTTRKILAAVGFIGILGSIITQQILQ